MITEVTKENIDEIVENSILPKVDAEKELNINPFGKYLILKEENNLIGYIYYSDIYERAEINQFEINAMYRNRGNGQKLLERLINIIDKNITLEVREGNIPAIKLYEKMGFEKKAIRKKYYNGEDGILMERVKE